MKVMYEFDAKDVAQLIADKYGISVHKVSANCDFEDVIFKLDMSEYETPNDKKSLTLPEPTDPAIQMRYEDLTDDKLAEYLAKGDSIVSICMRYGLDDKFKARLYKRAEKLKKECASNDRKQA